MSNTSPGSTVGTARAIDTDALIIGSGFGGAAPALRLAEAGLRVQVVERGERLGSSGIRRTQDPRYLRKHIRGTDGEVSITHVHAYGGASPFYEMVSLRSPSAAFEQRSDAGRLWPVGLDRATLDPYYELAESTMGVRLLEPDQTPKTGQVFAQLMRDSGHQCSRLPMAVGNCLGSGFCVTGCIFGAKRGPDSTYMPGAERAGATVRTGWVARTIRPLPGAEIASTRGAITGVPYRYEVDCVPEDADPKRYHRVTYRTRLLIIASGTVGTAGLLLRNRDRLRNLSRHVGRNVAFNVSSKVVALLPDAYPDVDNFTGQTIPGVVTYSLLESHGLVVFPAKPQLLQLMASARLAEPGPDGARDYWGPDHVALMKKYRRRGLVLVGLATGPPVARIRCTPGREAEPDRLRVEVQSESSRERFERTDATNTAVLQETLRRAGSTVLVTTPIKLDGSARQAGAVGGAHHVGSCRMGTTAAEGAVDAAGELFGHPGIFVTDGAAVPAAPGVNPSLTILANAERIAAGLVRRYLAGGAA